MKTSNPEDERYKPLVDDEDRDTIFFLKEAETWHGVTKPAGWYFRTEDEDSMGPYESEEAAQQAFYEYCRLVLGEPNDEAQD
jgi:hypothetical protein